MARNGKTILDGNAGALGFRSGKKVKLPKNVEVINKVSQS